MRTTSILAALFLIALSPRLNAAPRLVLSAVTLAPSPIRPGSNGPAQSVEAQNGGNGTLNLTASSTASWLSATVGAPQKCVVLTGTCDPVTITLATASLAAGSYTEFIMLADPNAIDSPQQIAVTITIAGVPGSLTFYAGPAGSSNDSAVAYIYPASPVTGTVSTKSGGNWLSFIPAGTFIAPLPNAISVEAGGLSPGTYTGSVAISGSRAAADNITIAVTLNVTGGPVIDLTQISTTELFGALGSGKVTSYFTFATTGGSALNITGAAGSAAFLSASVYSPSTIAITADPTGLASGTSHGNVTITSNAANNAAVSVPVDFIVSASAIPTISANGIVNPFTYVSEPFAPGEIVSVFGTQLAGPGTAAGNPGPPPLATTLGSTQVLFNGVPAPLYYVSPTQINFQIPYSVTAGQTATAQVVSGGVPGNLRPIAIVASSPRVVVVDGNYAQAPNLDGSFPLPSSFSMPGFVTHPAKPGDTLTFYAVGFGQTSPPAVEGVAASQSPLQYAATTTVGFGGGIFAPPPVTATPLYTGLTPTLVGLYQIDVTLPPNVPLGNAVPVGITVGSGEASVVNVAISANGQ